MRALEGAGGAAGHGVAVVAGLAGGHALVQVAGVIGAVVAGGTGCGRTRDIRLLVAGRRHQRDNENRNDTHGIALLKPTSKRRSQGHVAPQRTRHSHSEERRCMSRPASESRMRAKR